MEKYELEVLEAHKLVMTTKGREPELIDNRKMVCEKTPLNPEEWGKLYPDFNDTWEMVTLVPYFFLIKKIKENPEKTIKEVVGIGEINNIAAALAAFEEYDLLKRYLAEGNSLNVRTDVAAFRTWQPTPFFFATTNQVFDNVKDKEKLLRFLVENGADPNMVAGDDVSPLWNSCALSKSPELMKILLSLGADPNLQCPVEGTMYSPLGWCLLPDIDDDENELPTPESSVVKAKMLLKSGADPNIGLNDFTPLMQTIRYCEHNESALEILKLLIEKGADVNAFGEGYTQTPLLLTHDHDWLEAGKLLLLHGADVEIMNKLLEKRENQQILSLTTTAYTTFQPSSAGTDSDETITWEFDEITRNLQIEYFTISIKERTDKKLSGSIYWHNDDLSFDLGNFELTPDAPWFASEEKNVSYNTYQCLALRANFSDISLSDEYGEEEIEEEEVDYEALMETLKTVTDPYLEDISEDDKEEFYRFCSETEFGKFFVKTELHKAALMFWFGVFGEPFKRQLYGSQFDHILQIIWDMDYSHTPEELMLFKDENSAYYGFNKLLSVVYASWYRILQEEDERISDQELFELYAQAEQCCRRSMYQIGDYAFYNVMACLYLEGTLYVEYQGTEESVKALIREAQATYYNLSERDDLFNSEQQAILKMLNRIIGELLS